MTKPPDQDIVLKLRLSRLLFAMGYWSPIEVELSHYEGVQGDVKRRSLTDLDVLGIRFDELFSKRTVVGDCKSGKNVSDVNRLFWLLGIKKYFGADEAYFIRPHIDSHAKAIAPKMKVRVLTEADLSTLEKNADVASLTLPLADVSLRTQIVDLWGLHLAKGQKPTADELLLKGVYSYLTYSFWYIEAHRNLLTLIDQFERIAHLLDPGKPQHVLLAYVGAERFAYSLLDVASYVQAQGGSELTKYARIYLYGGPLALREKEQFFELLNKVTGQTQVLDPPPLEDVLELLGRLMRNPRGASDVLRYLSAIHLWCVRLGKKDPPAIGGTMANTAALVLAKDVAFGFAKTAGLNKLLFDAMTGL
jgi:hypothetical protein